MAAPVSSRRVIAPEALAEAARATGFSPAIRARPFVFLTGKTGAAADGVMPESAVTQTRNAVEKARIVLEEAGASLDAIVEMTSYHVGLRDHFEAVDAVLREALGVPLPAWTAVEVAGLRRPGAVIELRLVADAPEGTA